MNVFSFTGNIGKDAEIRHTAKGEPVVSVSVAVKSGYGDNAKTIWVKSVIFGKRGESVAPYLTKGQTVAVSGELSMNEWTNKDGEKVVEPTVRVNDITLVGKKEQTQQRQEKPQGKPQRDYSDDVPFN